jgi:hypothetical protein
MACKTWGLHLIRRLELERLFVLGIVQPSLSTGAGMQYAACQPRSWLQCSPASLPAWRAVSGPRPRW